MRTKQVGMFPSELVENGLRRGNHSFFFLFFLNDRALT